MSSPIQTIILSLRPTQRQTKILPPPILTTLTTLHQTARFTHRSLLTPLTTPKPAGVMQTTSASINSGSPLNYGLAAAAGVAATSGILFFVLAKKKSDEEEEAK